MKKFLLGLLMLVVLSIIGASVYVSFIDWNKHKSGIAEQLKEITGKKFVFSGPVSMKIFPMPSLTASNVKVYSTVNLDNEHPLMKIDSVVADLSFSALLGGNFDVKMMSLVKPEIYLHRKDGEINWLDNAQKNSQAKMKDVNIALDSVMLQEAIFNIVDDDTDVSMRLDHLNAEIIADTLNGPYRIDGSYIKDNNPEGFAISIGNLSDSFATNLNFVLSQPSSESYLRFDGTFLLSNDAVNGNLVLESKKFKAFYDSFFATKPMPSYFNDPVEASLELKVNKTQVELANIIFKYGATVGAGNIIVPLKSKSYIIGEEQDDSLHEVSAKFEMTDLNLTPVFLAIKDFVASQMQEKATYSPEIPFDLVLDLSALKAGYNNQTVKDFALRVSLHNDVWKLESIDGVFPGTTNIQATGQLLSVEDVLTYQLSVDAQTSNLKKFLEWFDIPVTTYANSTYLKSNLKANVSGDAKVLKISPFTLAVDNTVLSGQFGVKRGQPSHYALELETDSVILDNYLPRIFEGQDEPWLVIQNLWKKLAWVKDADFDLKLKSGLIIYERTSFDKVAFKATAQKGILNVETLSIGEVLNSNLNLSGEITGFGEKLQFSNLNYNVSINEFLPWLSKFDIDQPKWNFKYFQPFVSSGVVSLNAERLWAKVNNKTGDIESSYNGRIETENQYGLNGEIEIKSPNATEVLKNISVTYVPNDANLGRWSLKGNVVGNFDKFKFSDAFLSVGANAFQGNLGADLTRDVPHVVTDLKVNRFEVDRFIPQGNDVPHFVVDTASGNKGSFLSKPLFSDQPFKLDSLNNMSFVADLDVNELVFSGKIFKNVKAQLENKNGELNISKLQSIYNDGSIMADLKFRYLDKPVIEGKVNVTNQNVRDLRWDGEIYGISSGIIEYDVNVNTSASSPRDILDKFSGTLNVNIDSPILKGIDLKAISDDLYSRTASDGFQNLLQNSLQQNSTAFNNFSAQINFSQGEWQIDRALLKSDLATIDILGKGNLQSWSMDETFKVHLFEPQKINPFNFSLKGSIASPELEVDGSLITKIYDDQKARIEEEEKAKQEAHDQELRHKLEVQSVILQEERKSFNAFVNDTYLPLKNKVSADKYQAELEDFDKRIDAQIQAFDEAEDILKQKEVKDEYLSILANTTDAVKEEQAKIYTSLEALYINDMKQAISHNYEEIQKVNKEKELVMQDNLSKHETHVIRLNNIETGYRFQTDEMYTQLLRAIEGRLKDYDEIIKDINDYGESVQEEKDISVLEKYVISSAEMLTNAQKQKDLLADDIERYLNYVDEKLKVEEQAYADRKTAEAKAKQEAKEEQVKAEKKEVVGEMKLNGKAPIIVRKFELSEPTEEAETENDTESEAEIDVENSNEEVSQGNNMELDLFGENPPEIQASGTISKK